MFLVIHFARGAPAELHREITRDPHHKEVPVWTVGPEKTFPDCSGGTGGHNFMGHRARTAHLCAIVLRWMGGNSLLMGYLIPRVVCTQQWRLGWICIYTYVCIYMQTQTWVCTSLGVVYVYQEKMIPQYVDSCCKVNKREDGKG